MKKNFTKIISLLLIVGMNWSAVSIVAGTDAYFNDEEASPNNLFIATKLDFSLEFLMSDGFRTQTQGGWSSVASGDNPGAYRDANFDGAFPDGLVIGNIDYYNTHFISTIGNAGDYYALFTSSSAIQEFLPAGGTANPFSQFHEDPLSTEAGVLAGQVVALTLNTGFDNYDEDFGVNQSKLQDFYANSVETQCEDMTVGEVLAEANLVLSGQFSEFSPSEISKCVDEINNKFVGGEETKITPTESVWREITIIKNEGINFQHIIEAEIISGDLDLCAALNVEAYLDDDILPKYSGALADLLNEPPVVFSEPADKWKLYIGLDENAPSEISNKSCEFKYIVSGWQENINTPGGGFSDVEEIIDSVDSDEWESAFIEPLVVSSAELSVVMNEFLPNPEGFEYGFDFGTDHSDMPQGEWIELFNNDDINSYDLAGWYFEDLAGNTIDITTGNSSLNSTVIPTSGWMVIYMNQAVLNNTGEETVTLFNGENEIVDSYAYSGNDYCDLTPTPEDQNIDDPSGSCSGVPPNKSYARIPDGIGDWVDPIPTPGVTNKVNENLIISFLNDLIGNDDDSSEDTTDFTPEYGTNSGDTSGFTAFQDYEANSGGDDGSVLPDPNLDTNSYSTDETLLLSPPPLVDFTSEPIIPEPTNNDVDNEATNSIPDDTSGSTQEYGANDNIFDDTNDFTQACLPDEQEGGVDSGIDDTISDITTGNSASDSVDSASDDGMDTGDTGDSDIAIAGDEKISEDVKPETGDTGDGDEGAEFTL